MGRLGRRQEEEDGRWRSGRTESERPRSYCLSYAPNARSVPPFLPSSIHCFFFEIEDRPDSKWSSLSRCVDFITCTYCIPPRFPSPQVMIRAAAVEEQLRGVGSGDIVWYGSLLQGQWHSAPAPARRGPRARNMKHVMRWGRLTRDRRTDWHDEW